MHRKNVANRSNNSDIITRETRRKHVAEYLQQNMSELEIAQLLKVNQSTISRDIKALEEQATQFVYSLAKNARFVIIGN